MQEDPRPVEATAVAKCESTDGPDVVRGADSEARALRAGLPWKRWATVAGAATLVAGAAVVATLAATRKSAVQMNFQAYVNGMNDALEAVRNGFDPSDDY